MALARDAVIGYMKAQRRAICVTCLAEAVGLSFDRTMDAWSDIRRRGDLPIRLGKCWVCTRWDDVMYPGPAETTRHSPE